MPAATTPITMFRMRTPGVPVSSRMDTSTIASPTPGVIFPSPLVTRDANRAEDCCDRGPGQERADQDKATTDQHDDRTGLAGGDLHRPDEITTRRRRWWECRHSAGIVPSAGSVLLVVNQQLGKGGALRVAPELSDPVGPLEVRKHQDVEQLGAGSGACR